MLIINGVIHTMDGETISSGFVYAKGSRIVQAGPMEMLPEDIEVTGAVDARGGHVLPGFIDAHCHLGLYGCGGPEDDLNENAEPFTPHIRALDGVNPFNYYFGEALRAGVTCVLTGPGSANPIAGQSVLLKTAGQMVDRMVVRAPAAMKFALGENPKNVHKGHGPATRMATAALIREKLSQALDYELRCVRAESDCQMDAPEPDVRLDALRSVVMGRLPAHFHVHRADDIATALRISREFGLDCAVVHGTEGHLIADLLAEAGVPVITGPALGDRCKPELANMSLETPAILRKAGVPFAICTDHPEVPIQYLPLCAALAVKGGMGAEEALAAITINAAKIAGLDHALGSLTPGKEADIVVTDRHPLELLGKVKAVLMGGRRI